MSDELASFLRDELGSLLDEAIQAAESTGSTQLVGRDTLLVTDDDGNRYSVVVTFDGPAA